MAQKSKEANSKVNLSVQEINKLEEAWKSNPKLKFNDLAKKKYTKRLKPVFLKYHSGKQYKSIF